MLEIDFSRFFEAETTKSTNVKPKSLHIGDSRRFSGLPDKVDSKFLEMYKETLDYFLYPYVAKNQISISHAYNYAKVVTENVFGNENHLGLYHYLKDKNVKGVSDKELVIQAEKMLLQGWSVRLEGNRYWLFDSEFQKIIDLTGNSEESVESEAQSFDSSNAHLFFDEKTASKITAFSERLGYNPDDLSLTNSLDLLMSKTDNKEFKGYLTNYERLKVILEKNYKYRTLTPGKSMFDLYSDSYKLSSKVVPNGVVLESKTNDLLVFPAESKVNTVHNMNKFLLAQLANDIRSLVYPNFKKIKYQNIEPIKEFRHVYAFTCDFWDTDVMKKSFFESVDVMKKMMDSNKKSVQDSLAVLIVTESLLLGNDWFSDAAVGIDSMSENFYVYFNWDAFTKDSIHGTEKSTVVYPYRETVFDWVKKLPKKYVDVLESIEFSTDEYVQDFNTVRNYFESARNFILKEMNS